MPRKSRSSDEKNGPRPLKSRRPIAIHMRIVELMKRHPEGISSGQIREELGFAAGEQTHLDKRKRELRQWFAIRKSTAKIDGRDGRTKTVTLYHFEGELDETEAPSVGSVNKRVRAHVIHSAHERCQMCGRTIAKHGIALVVDHKKPLNWGGSNDPENLWAICEDCNEGKKAYFSSLKADDALMKRVTSEDSVHVRLGETLKAFGAGKPVPAYLLELIADQDEWRKRIRDLRYPVIGWTISVKKYKKGGRMYADYVLERWKAWPDDPTGAVRKYEDERKKRNSARENASVKRDTKSQLKSKRLPRPVRARD